MCVCVCVCVCVHVCVWLYACVCVYGRTFAKFPLCVLEKEKIIKFLCAYVVLSVMSNNCAQRLAKKTTEMLLYSYWNCYSQGKFWGLDKETKFVFSHDVICHTD